MEELVSQLKEGQLMRKRILLISIVFVLCIPVLTYPEDAMQGVVILPTASDVVSQESSGLSGLSDGEKKGLYYCRTKGVFLDLTNDKEYVTIIFRNRAPVYLRKTELTQDLVRKIFEMREDEVYEVSCIMAFWRDDWQKVYDQYNHVTDKLLDIEKCQP